MDMTVRFGGVHGQKLTGGGGGCHREFMGKRGIQKAREITGGVPATK
jgi:hypothetical protein